MRRAIRRSGEAWREIAQLQYRGSAARGGCQAPGKPLPPLRIKEQRSSPLRLGVGARHRRAGMKRETISWLTALLLFSATGASAQSAYAVVDLAPNQRAYIKDYVLKARV